MNLLLLVLKVVSHVNKKGTMVLTSIEDGERSRRKEIEQEILYFQLFAASKEDLKYFL